MFDYTASPGLLKDRVILISGAGRGIGAAAAKSCAAHGATVLLLGKTEKNLNKVYDEICAAGHPEPVVIPLDLGKATAAQFDELGAMIETEFGRLDGLLNNASILGPRMPLQQIDDDKFAEVMQINVQATFGLTRALLPLLQLAPDGVLFGEGLVQGIRGVRQMTAVSGECFGGFDRFCQILFPLCFLRIHRFDIPLVGSVDLRALL